MTYDHQNDSVNLSVEELAYYAYQRENSALLLEKFGFIKTVVTSNEKAHPDYSLSEEERLSQAISGIADSYSEYIDSTHTEILLTKETVCGEYNVTVSGLSDIISYDGVLHTVEAVKTVRRLTPELSPFSDPEFFARATILSYIYCEDIGVSEIKIKLTFIAKSSGERLSYTALFKRIALERMFDTLICRAHPFIEAFADSVTLLPSEIDDMPFPYKSIREGQEQFIKTAYRTIKRGENLLVSAPTGIGKTMSALFPSVKALGSGAADKIFYLTAKTITGRAALEAAKMIQSHSPHFRSCMILSKETVCPLKKKFGAPGMMSGCYSCDYVDSLSKNGGTVTVSYREREVAALSELLKSDDKVYTPESIRKTAENYFVCPYELSLDLSEYCGLVVCDCNYVIDDNVRFRRYFKRDGNHDRYVFLFDEAHNLPDRTRNTYSATVKLSSAKKLLSEIEKLPDGYSGIYDSAVSYLHSLDEIFSLCRDGEYIKQTENGEISCGYYEDKHIPDCFAKSSNDLYKQLSRLMNRTDFSEIFGGYFSELNKLSFVISNFDDKFRIFCSREGNELTVELLCIDPAGIIEKMLSAASSVIMFSATLSPMDYFSEVTGLTDANMLDLPSPYEKDNMCLVSYDSISTRYSDRKSTAEDCAEVIVETVSAKEGNYIVYFPSYEYMKRVCRVFASVMPECAIVMQKPGMSYKERQRFIDIFHERRNGTVVGFCVLGGMFSEGIDLAGESLIGVIIIGCGMPQLSAERNIMAAYYDEKTERGHEFAYTCPGMNKVLQAAGRVIRSENDRGVIVLIDDRLNEPNMKMLFPPHWRHMRYTSNLTSLQMILEEFWRKNNI